MISPQKLGGSRSRFRTHYWTQATTCAGSETRGTADTRVGAGRAAVLVAATREADIGRRGRALEGRVWARRVIGAMAGEASEESIGAVIASGAARSGTGGTPWELIAEHTNTLGLFGYPAATSNRSEHSPTGL